MNTVGISELVTLTQTRQEGAKLCQNELFPLNRSGDEEGEDSWSAEQGESAPEGADDGWGHVKAQEDEPETDDAWAEDKEDELDWSQDVKASADDWSDDSPDEDGDWHGPEGETEEVVDAHAGDQQPCGSACL